MEELRYILKYIRGLFAHTEETWERLAEPGIREAEIGYMTRFYYYPLMGFGALLIFILHGNGVMLHSKMTFDAPFNFEYAMKGMIAFALSYVASPTLARLLIQQIFTGLTRIPFEKEQLELFVHYSMSIVMVIDMFCSCLPYFTFLSFIGLYLINVVYLGAVSYLRLQNARGLFLVVSSLSIYFSPWLIQRVLSIFAK